jgi:putative phage-type endonuclease
MRIDGVDQNSPEWVIMRVGCLTASGVAKIKGKDARTTYKMQLVTEAITGRATNHFVTDAMKWGIETQAMASVAYEMRTGLSLDPGGLWISDKIPRFAASPDYLVGEDGLIECKCPNSATHFGYLLAGVVPADYKPQMIAQMACTGRQWCDFVSFDPRVPEKHQLFVKRLERDEKAISEMESEVTKFLSEVDDLLLRLRQDDPSSLVPQLVKSLEAV